MYDHGISYEKKLIMNKNNSVYSDRRLYDSGAPAREDGREGCGGGPGANTGRGVHGSDSFYSSDCVHPGDSARISDNKNPINLYSTPTSHMTTQESENDTTTYKIVVDTVLRIQTVFEEVYTYLHGVLFHLSTDGGFGPYTEAMASQLEAFRMSASRAVYTPDDRLYYKDVELRYRRGFDGRKQNSYYKDKYYVFYEENKNVEAVKHLAKIEVQRKDKDREK